MSPASGSFADCRATALDIVMLETGAGNGNRLKFAEAIHKQQPIARILEVGREQAESPHPFSGFLKLPLQSKQAVEVLQHAVRPVTSHLLPFGPFMLDSANDILFCPNGEKQLRPMETRLLSYLVVNRSVIVKRVDLMRHVWGTEYFDDTRTLDVHIRQLRKHLEEPLSPAISHHGAGSWLSVEGLVPNTTPIPYALQPRWESSRSLSKSSEAAQCL